MDDRDEYARTPLMEGRKRKIKGVARQLIISRGIGRTTMKDIAMETGIGRKTLYRFFGDIEAIAREIMADIATSPESFTATFQPAGGTSVERLRHAARSWLDWCLGHQDLMRFYYEYDYHFRVPDNPFMHDFWKTKTNVFTEIVRCGMEDGSFNAPPEKLWLLSFTIPNTIIAVVHRVLFREAVYRVEYGYSCQDIGELVDLLIYGMCGASQPKGPPRDE